MLFDDMGANMKAKKKIYPIVTELLIRSIKFNILLVLKSKFYFQKPKDIRLKVTHLMKIPKKTEH